MDNNKQVNNTNLKKRKQIQCRERMMGQRVGQLPFIDCLKEVPLNLSWSSKHEREPGSQRAWGQECHVEKAVHEQAPKEKESDSLEEKKTGQCG